jgi:hypothetical protein
LARRSDVVVVGSRESVRIRPTYPFGSGYPGPGATIGPVFVFGWLAGETAAAGWTTHSEAWRANDRTLRSYR